MKIKTLKSWIDNPQAWEHVNDYLEGNINSTQCYCRLCDLYGDTSSASMDMELVMDYMSEVQDNE